MTDKLAEAEARLAVIEDKIVLAEAKLAIAERKIEARLAEAQAEETRVHALKMVKAELEDEVRGWPELAAKSRLLKQQLREFAESKH